MSLAAGAKGYKDRDYNNSVNKTKKVEIHKWKKLKYVKHDELASKTRMLSALKAGNRETGG